MNTYGITFIMLIVGFIGLVCWSIRVNNQAEEAAEAHRKKTPDPYDKGEAAAMAGQPFWANPYCLPSGSTRAHDRWLAGWSFGKQRLEGTLQQTTNMETAP
jgi:hypothetical protein